MNIWSEYVRACQLLEDAGGNAPDVYSPDGIVAELLERETERLKEMAEKLADAKGIEH